MENFIIRLTKIEQTGVKNRGRFVYKKTQQYNYFAETQKEAQALLNMLQAANNAKRDEEYFMFLQENGWFLEFIVSDFADNLYKQIEFCDSFGMYVSEQDRELYNKIWRS